MVDNVCNCVRRVSACDFWDVMYSFSVSCDCSIRETKFEVKVAVVLMIY